MKFEFSLEPVLKVRKHEEKVHKQKLAEKLNKKKNLDELKEDLQQKLQSYFDEGDEDGFANLHDLQRHQQYIKDLQQKVKKVNESLDSIKNAIEEQRDKLAEVHKSRHIMEKVKEEEHEIFLEKVSRQEQKNMDEVATQSYSH